MKVVQHRQYVASGVTVDVWLGLLLWEPNKCDILEVKVWF